MLEKVKQPIVQFSKVPSVVASFVAAIISLGSLVGGFLFIDDRYAHADEVNKLFKRTETQQIEITQQLQSQLTQYKKNQLEDALFALQLKKQFNKADKVDDAMMLRYSQQLKDLQTNGK